jgi:hypothetical protein
MVVCAPARDRTGVLWLAASASSCIMSTLEWIVALAVVLLLAVIVLAVLSDFETLELAELALEVVD